MNFCRDFEEKKFTREVFKYENRDPQAIPWDTGNMLGGRISERVRRMRTYNSFRNNNAFPQHEDDTVNFSGKYFDFIMNHNIPSEFSHFQLRNMVQCAGPEEIYVKTHPNKLQKYNPVKRTGEIMAEPPFTTVSFAVHKENILLGGMEGELMMMDTHGGIKFSRVLSEEDSRITNSVKMFEDQGRLFLMVCNNDKTVRIFDPEIQIPHGSFPFAACVNHATVSNDLKKIALCLDSTEDLVIDRNTGEVLHTLMGHTDFGFSVDWDPNNEFVLATGNQDRTVMIWDIRQGSVLSPVHILHSRLGAALNVQYSKNGKYLAFAESGDFVNFFDKREYKERQCTDLFGEISGFCFSEDSAGELSVFIGMADTIYHSLIECQERSGKNINI